jgi:hypothetical protein
MYAMGSSSQYESSELRCVGVSVSSLYSLSVIVCIYADRLLVHLHPELISMSNSGTGWDMTGGAANTNYPDEIIDTVPHCT